jgi:alkylation response protein AidB-like acyl-CoA dehydrogenase
VATELEHRDEYPAQIVEGMKKLGLFGLTIGEQYGGLGGSLLIYALAVEEIARGWMSVSGIINTHFIVAHMIARHGTDEQKDYFLPRMAAGDVRGAFTMSEPGVGSDVAAIRTRAVRDGGGFRAQRAEDVADQRRHRQPGGGAAPDRRRPRGPAPEHEHVPDREGAGLRREPVGPRPDRVGEDREDGIQGGRHHMDGVEVGRVNVAARGCGIALRAFELAIGYAQQRHTFGQPIA